MSVSTLLDALARRDDEQASADARQALLDRRADRARQLIAAAEVVLLGLDDEEAITLTADLSAYSHLPGVRHL